MNRAERISVPAKTILLEKGKGRINYTLLIKYVCACISIKVAMTLLSSSSLGVTLSHRLTACITVSLVFSIWRALSQREFLL